MWCECKNITQGETVSGCVKGLHDHAYHYFISNYGILTLLATVSEEITPEIAWSYTRIKFTP